METQTRIEPLNVVRIESGADTEILDKAINELEQPSDKTASASH